MCKSKLLNKMNNTNNFNNVNVAKKLLFSPKKIYVFLKSRRKIIFFLNTFGTAETPAFHNLFIYLFFHTFALNFYSD